MMALNYISKVISRNEKILSLTRAHWIYALEGVFWLVVLSAVGFIADHYFYRYVGRYAPNFVIDLGYVRFDERHTPLPWFFVGTGVIIFWQFFLVYITHQLAITNERVIHKKGLISVQIEQTDLRDIDAEDVKHGWLGWLLGYGRVRLDCRFVDDMYLPAIARPYRFVKALHVARMKNHDIDYGEDDFERNVQLIKQKKQQAMLQSRMIKLAQQLKMSFTKNS